MPVQPMLPEATTHLWGLVLEAVQLKLETRQAFDTWFKPVVPLSLSPQLVELEVPNPFFIDWIHQYHLRPLRQSLQEVFGAEPEIRFTARDPVSAPNPASPSPPVPRVVASLPAEPRSDRSALDSRLNPRLSFSSFVVGSSNAFAHAGCRAVAQRPGEAYNPLFIFAGSGLGKTHLLHAIGHMVRQDRPTARIYYVSAERFTNEMIYSIQHAQTLAFRNKYRSVDVLLIDDIQFLAGKESTQEEFFYTFNALRDAHKQVVVTADKAPKDIPMLEERLTSRFNQGLVTDIKQPDLETRLAILRNRCELEGEGVRISDDVLLLIGDRIRTNIRDLEGAVNRLTALAKISRADLNIEFAARAMEPFAAPARDNVVPSPARLLEAVCQHLGVSLDHLRSTGRARDIAYARHLAMYLLRGESHLTYAAIAQLLNKKDHSTVVHACSQIGKESGVSTSVRADIDAVKALLNTSTTAA